MDEGDLRCRRHIHERRLRDWPSARLIDLAECGGESEQGHERRRPVPVHCRFLSFRLPRSFSSSSLRLASGSGKPSFSARRGVLGRERLARSLTQVRPPRAPGSLVP